MTDVTLKGVKLQYEWLQYLDQNNKKDSWLELKTVVSLSHLPCTTTSTITTTTTTTNTTTTTTTTTRNPLLEHSTCSTCKTKCKIRFSPWKCFKGPHTRSILLSIMQHCTSYWSCMSDIDATILCESIDINNIVSIKLIVYGLPYSSPESIKWIHHGSASLAWNIVWC